MPRSDEPLLDHPLHQVQLAANGDQPGGGHAAKEPVRGRHAMHSNGRDRPRRSLQGDATLTRGPQGQAARLLGQARPEREEAHQDVRAQEEGGERANLQSDRANTPNRGRVPHGDRRFQEEPSRVCQQHLSFLCQSIFFYKDTKQFDRFLLLLLLCFCLTIEVCCAQHRQSSRRPMPICSGSSISR